MNSRFNSKTGVIKQILVVNLGYVLTVGRDILGFIRPKSSAEVFSQFATLVPIEDSDYGVCQY